MENIVKGSYKKVKGKVQRKVAEQTGDVGTFLKGATNEAIGTAQTKVGIKQLNDKF